MEFKKKGFHGYSLDVGNVSNKIWTSRLLISNCYDQCYAPGGVDGTELAVSGTEVDASEKRWGERLVQTSKTCHQSQEISLVTAEKGASPEYDLPYLETVALAVDLKSVQKCTGAGLNSSS
ncbi:hypothetical protein RF11_14748 [Thelohanellus kitauei]|uniref:Uncharacterized protein n=1 Tax=Thelohanellus kitauei TaxID=669202 RepID=A0A0C2MGD1_THEKT|nr:hypothetical protein RF11_14748 [Thelohanellus kitauei]